MRRCLFTLPILGAIALAAAPLPAAELSVSLGIRQTFPAGDVNGDLVIDGYSGIPGEPWFGDLAIVESNYLYPGTYFQGDMSGDGFIDHHDFNIIEENLGATTSGVIGSDGGTTGPLFTTGSQTLPADGAWHQLTFTLPLKPPGNHPYSDWGVLESLRFTNTADGETKYKVWIDDLASTNSSGATVFGDFEAFNPGDEVIFQQPGGADILAMPIIAEVTDAMAFSGSRSLVTEFEFLDDTPGRTTSLSTAGVANLPNPLVQLRDSDYTQFTITQTTITFWAKAVVVPEPASTVLMLLGICVGLCRLRKL